MNNLEKRELIERDYEMYEDEIDLKELFLVLWRNKIKIASVALICMVLGFASGKIMAGKNKKATVVLEYNYPGIEAGKTPSGEAFNLTYSQFKNIFMIKDIYNKMPELKNEAFSQDDMLNSIKVSPVLPEKLKEGEIYYPTSFTYTLKLTGSDEKDEEVLKNFIDIQKKYFQENYKLAVKIPYLDFKEAEHYDYIDMVAVINSSIDSAVESINKIDNSYVSTKDYIQLQSLAKELKILKNVNMNKVKDMINEYNITKNPEKLLVAYKQNIEYLNVDKQKITGKIAQLENMIKSYKPTDKNIVIMSNGNSEKIKTEEENYYTEFLRELAASKIRLSDINVQIKYLQEKMGRNLNIDDEKSREVNSELEFVVNKFDEKVKKVNEISIENYNKKYADVIKVQEPVSTKADSKTLIFTLAGLVLGGFLGTCYVLLMNFIHEEKKKTITK